MSGANTERPIATTMTFLKMDAKPMHAPPPRPMLHCAILQAEKPPVHFYRYLYDTIGRDYFWFDRRNWNDDKLAALLGDAAVELYVLHVSGVPAGMAELDFRDPETCTLAYFGLMPDFVGRGIGPWLLHQAVEIAWQHPISKLLVHTNTLDHPRALATYQRAGFEPYAREERTIMVPSDFTPG